jgi:hypothetical protein
MSIAGQIYIYRLTPESSKVSLNVEMSKEEPVKMDDDYYMTPICFEVGAFYFFYLPRAISGFPRSKTHFSCFHHITFYETRTFFSASYHKTSGMKTH